MSLTPFLSIDGDLWFLTENLLSYLPAALQPSKATRNIGALERLETLRMECTHIDWEAVGAIATAAAAIVALGIALADGWRRRRAHIARGRLAMASLYSPMSGVLMGLQRRQCDSMAFAQALPGSGVMNVAENAERLEKQCEMLESFLQMFDEREAVYLPNDYGTVLTVTVRDVSMLVRLVQSATRVYIPLRDSGQFAVMHKAATSQATGAALAQSAIENLQPFLADCRKELGEKDIKSFMGLQGS